MCIRDRVCPTNNNHVLMLKATDEDGNVLPEFEKVLDIDIKAAAEAALGKTLDQNLLSVVFDYEGNLWFATGGFRIYPDKMCIRDRFIIIRLHRW